MHCHLQRFLCRSQSKDAERCFFVGVICVSFFDLTFSQIISSESSARDTQKKKKKKTDCTNIRQRAVLRYHHHTTLTLALIKGSQTFHILRKLHVQFLSLIHKLLSPPPKKQPSHTFRHVGSHNTTSNNCQWTSSSSSTVNDDDGDDRHHRRCQAK